ncbi:hypothetical protein [Leucobacter aridicollis]|uniref:hypothetical protein n=1 Tax=Leucobacter aridicollis TaxID=283878 RepID=UPI002166DCF1|nr:hypothetical protein [Leucobacter aridicollis]MCS3427099.1 hypothetical protein [Leucobacter aridicollis]
MNTSIHNAATDQSERAKQAIELGLALDREARSETLARLIAGSIHEGPGTALERFAGNGILDAERALNELNRLIVPLEQEGWVDALGRYILFAGRSES